MKVKKELHAHIASDAFLILDEISKKTGKKKARVIEELIGNAKTLGAEITPISFKDLKYSLKRIPTGIPSLDKVLHGGFPSNFLVVVTGDPGSGKTIFGLQFLFGVEERAMLFTFEENPSQLAKHAFQIGLNLSERSRKGNLFVYNLKAICVEEILEKIVLERPKRVVIDSVAAHHGENDEPTAWYQLLSELKKEDIACVLITRSEESHKVNLFENRSDGVIHLEAKLVDDCWERYLIVKKMRATPLEKVRFRFKITDNGIRFG
jgi:KaiC/GvpD/RAD55 family RecA-like ATPase